MSKPRTQAQHADIDPLVLIAAMALEIARRALESAAAREAPVAGPAPKPVAPRPARPRRSNVNKPGVK